MLGVSPNASDKELKVAYLKAAKKYHPDIYKGVNRDHFKKINEAFSTLKNPAKRSEYDNRQRIRTQRSAEPFQKQKARKVRDEQDPEFEAAFKKLNTKRLFDQFMARPMRSTPEELSEELMQPVQKQKMSRRDLARQKFIQEFRRKQMQKESLKNRAIVEYERYQDIEAGIEAEKHKTYQELVDDINKDMKAIEHINRPLALYKDE